MRNVTTWHVMSSQGHDHVPGFEGTAPSVHTHMAHCLQILCTHWLQQRTKDLVLLRLSEYLGWGYDRSSTILFTYQYFHDWVYRTKYHHKKVICVCVWIKYSPIHYLLLTFFKYLFFLLLHNMSWEQKLILTWSRAETRETCKTMSHKWMGCVQLFLRWQDSLGL